MLNLNNCIIYVIIYICMLLRVKLVLEVYWFVDLVLFIIENNKIDFGFFLFLLNKILLVLGGKEKYFFKKVYIFSVVGK